MTLALWTVQVLSLGIFAMSGVKKTFMTAKAKETLPWLTPLAAVSLVTIQLLAINTVHVPRKEYYVVSMDIVLLALVVFVPWDRLGLLFL
jgi:hydrogenase/urease accessory protein HupE